MRGKRAYKIVDRLAGVPLLLVAGTARGAGTIMPVKPGDRILLIKQSALGDTLLILPVIKALRDVIGSEGRLDMVVTPVNRDVAASCPWLDELFLFNPSSVFRRPGHVLRLIRRLRHRAYAHALDFDQWLRSSALLAALSGARHTAGFRTPGQQRHFAFDATVPQAKDAHEFELFKHLAVQVGVPAESIEPYTGFLTRHRIYGSTARETRKIVLLHPGCGGHGFQREWPIERYAELGRALVERFGVGIEVSGHGSHEIGLIEEFASLFGPGFTNLGGELTFPELAARMTGIDLLVSGNTGVMHLAAGMGVPLVSLHGPTDSTKWGPLYGESPTAETVRVIQAHVPCSPCLFLGFEYGCAERPCMESISVEEVLEACEDVLAALACFRAAPAQ